MKRLVGILTLLAAAATAFASARYEDLGAGVDMIGTGRPATGTFNRIASFLVCLQDNATCDDDAQTVAEIVDVSSDGMTLVYTDSASERLGFVDITNPAQPAAGGVIPLRGEPTSVAVAGDYALVAVNTSADYVNVSGHLDVVDIARRRIVATLDLGGQPDAVAHTSGASIGEGRFIIVERDNQGGPDAAVKRLYTVDLSSVTDGQLISRRDKTLLRDLLAEGDITRFGNLAFEKIEGSAFTADGNVYISNDNDGVDDNSGENQLINLGRPRP